MSVMQQVKSLSNPEMDQLCINTIRTLSIDAVQQAKSGHPNRSGPIAIASCFRTATPPCCYGPSCI